MIVDSSAIIAILRGEPDRERFVAALRGSSSVAMSAATYVEAGIVIDAAHEPAASRTLDRFVRAFAVDIREVTARQAMIARQAYRDYGRGSGHPARLNVGDCFAYALAIEADEPLLFHGDDFAQTDVRRAAP